MKRSRQSRRKAVSNIKIKNVDLELIVSEPSFSSESSRVTASPIRTSTPIIGLGGTSGVAFVAAKRKDILIKKRESSKKSILGGVDIKS